VDLGGSSLTVKDTKNHQTHTLPLSDYLVDMFTRRKRHTVGEYAFEGRRGRLSNLRYAMSKVMADSLDIPGYAVKMLLNHKQASDVTAGYIVADVERLRAPMQQITDYILKCARVRKSADVVEFKQVSRGKL
jgi:integrase